MKKDNDKMKKIIGLFCGFMIIVFLQCGCTIKKDEYFAQKGQYIVECINAQKNAENAEYYFTKEGDYYYIDDNTKIYKYSSDQEKAIELLNCDQVIYDLRICGKYIYYASYAQVYRYNMETEEIHCIFSDDTVAYVCMDIYKDYLYVMDGQKDYIYRCALDNVLHAEYEDVCSFFQQEHKENEVVQILLDGLIVEGYFDEAEQAYRILSMRAQDTGRRILRGNTELFVDGKRVMFERDKKTGAYMPYSYRLEGETPKTIKCLEKKEYNLSDMHEESIYQNGDSDIVGLISVSNNPNVSSQLYQSDIKRDILFNLNISTGESKIIYDTIDNMTRIIGYNNGIVYLFKDDYKIYSQPLSGEKATEIASIPRSDDVVFDWCGEYLIVRYKDTYQEKQSLYEIELIEISS